MKKDTKVTFTVSLEDAETLQSLVRGSKEGADDVDFVKFADRVLKGLDKNIQIFTPKERHFKNSIVTPESKSKLWKCNECDFSNFTGSISQEDIDTGRLQCVHCGCDEFHLV